MEANLSNLAYSFCGGVNYDGICQLTVDSRSHRLEFWDSNFRRITIRPGEYVSDFISTDNVLESMVWKRVYFYVGRWCLIVFDTHTFIEYRRVWVHSRNTESEIPIILLLPVV